MNRHVVIVGGGFCGATLLFHLLRRGDRSLRVTVVDPSLELGRGLAYAAWAQQSLLNVPCGDMSLDAAEPDDFLVWARLRFPNVTPHSFLPRAVYGQYIMERVYSVWRDECVAHLRDSVTMLRPELAGWQVTLSRGHSLMATEVVLALGNPPMFDPLGQCGLPTNHPYYFPTPWPCVALPITHRNASVMMIGTGLSMVDQYLALRAQGHSGPCYAVSRHGLLPHTHITPLPILPSELAMRIRSAVSQGTLYQRLRAFRSLVRQAGPAWSWQAQFKVLRENATMLWQTLPHKERHRFIRHLRPYWDAHRHRMAPEVGEAILSAVQDGALQLLRGRFLHVHTASGRFVVTMAVGPDEPTSLEVDVLINCTGPCYQAALRRPLEQTLVQQGLAQPDVLGLGLQCMPDGQMIDVRGQPVIGLHMIGHARRGSIWESTSVPELRVQAQQLASLLLRVATPHGAKPFVTQPVR
ncbi:FAD/NAD(P)-binding protein [Chitinivorax sp. B]|uniref:FAD/NAD(P)-binding protein n=1 Tax=Chitinivorax sp. B TaxID=2502235 RepID=UPI0010F4BCFD|nr:FAD/NAD(P)-binding protein [Chitinivorax sp. B]